MYARVFTEPFLEDLRFHRRNRGLLRRVEEKVSEILENPEHYKPLRGALKGKRRAHVGPFVLVFEVVGDRVFFHALRHHDVAYR